MSSKEFTTLLCVIVMVGMILLDIPFLIIAYVKEKKKFKEFIEREKIKNEDEIQEKEK